ncbi:FMN-binding glutamate synthase family protein [Psychroserpens sp.]|uniref:FMN-binding glutamate synthase family protein n=1 Tax=Psychroserpens sp. TaxID=2020870 RepID=UPI001B0DB04C|nr:FMN-binding glutamate synthase family protein [Psychroserpens sp.]MBO6607456.1 FMN-binding glutamate synthase family protein [Psychroserpens sp.]MBO6631319.1 FMN-binding glutamate synthase family protein [Psychroserpens sp.]MBO6654466.1 FMN-binding glutamate synthase family protein [Psychroserpens sp.]MBO6681185.1 FMN-binding glutamate synthase family protein [Psychroserpens sp.]MBO6749858.1 FMN-binding glutamate synthase family protein [Psychroserpens sp.]
MDSILDTLSSIPWWLWIIIVLALIAIRDVLQKKHTISHNFPVIGHIRYMLESIGPELRQYLVANNREELPFNRIERSWVYASSKSQNNYEGFGTDRDIFAHQHIFVNNAMFPFKVEESHPNAIDNSFLPCAKIIGAYNNRKRPYRPASIINVSAMSYGSLSARAIDSLNKGVILANAFHNTGEGGLSPYHSNGGDVVFHFGTGYFGVRTEDGNFSMEKMKQLVESNPFIRAIEIKLSQGAKPGKGGVLPGSKITKEIAEIRGVEVGKTVLSPPNHKAFSTVPELVDFIEAIAEETGLPVGIKAAIGKLEQWEELADVMKKTGKGPDFITVDGGEGGTGAAPPSFADHVSLPWVYGFGDLYKLFQKKGICDRVVFIGSGKLGFPAKAAMAFAMGVDCINVAREAMMSIGCIQAQICHTNRCPSGVATQSKWLQNGIDPYLKSVRLAQYFKTFRKEFLEITHASGYEHPCQFTMDDIDVNVDDHNLSKELANTYQYHKTHVPFNSMQELKDCLHLGGKYTNNN